MPRAKIAGYLLSDSHPSGRAKAVFFCRFGFSAEAWELLAEALKRHAAEYEVAGIEESPFGKRYVIEGPLRSPDGRDPPVRAIWFIESGKDAPRFVTAYPLWRPQR